jgi:hypothetical protein
LDPAARGPASATASELEDHLSAVLTVADILETFGRLALDSASGRASQIFATCMRWAASASRGAPGRKVVLQGTSSPPARTDWHGLLSFFRDARRAESQAVVQAKHDLTDSVQAFARIFHNVLLGEQAIDADCARALVRLNSALANPADGPLLEAANELVGNVGTLLLNRQRSGEGRLRALRDHVRQLEGTHALSGLHNPFEVDRTTGLHNNAAFLEHLNFLAVTGGLFERPPLLAVLRIANTTQGPQDPEEDLALALTGALDHAFPERNCYLSRPNAHLFTAVCAASEFSRVHLCLLDLLHEATHNAVLSRSLLRVGLASNVPGETSETWYVRAKDACASADSFECVIAAAPARFEDRA